MTETQKVIWEQQKMYPTESEYFTVLYGYKNGHIVVDAGKDGRICMKLDLANDFISELLEMIEFYKGVSRHA